MATAPKVSDVLKPVDDYYNSERTKNLKAGTQSTLVGLLTGIPDLGVAAYNFATGGNVKDLRTRALETAGIPTKASSPEYDLAYNLPEYLSIGYSVGSLANALRKGGKALIQNRKFNKVFEDLVDKGDLEKADLGALRKIALTGQGTDSPRLSAIFNRLKDNPKFTEIFTTLDKAALETSLKGMAPAASKLNEPDATKHAVEAITGKMDDIIKAKNTAGDAQFERARGLLGDRPVVSTDNTLSSIQRMRNEYAGKGTDSAKAVLKFLDSIEERIVPTITASATQGTSVSRSPLVGDTLMNIPAQSGASMSIPGASGYTTKAAPKAFTLGETQSFLREWGKKIGIDNSAIAGAGSDDIQRVYKTLFGSLSNDMRLSAKAANDAGDLATQRGLEAAIKGRQAVKEGYTAYSAAVAQGVPKWLQGKSIDEIPFEELMSTYKGLNPSQRAVFRGYLGDTGGEALKAIDSKVYQDFISGAARKLDDGTYGVDPAAVALKWKELSKDKSTVDALSQALGTNAGEFENRMNSLYAFTRKMQTGSEAGAAGAIEKIAPDAARLAGLTGGYPAHQGVALSADVWKKMTNGVSDDMFMKMLLSPETKDFLKASGMTKGSRNVLESLDSLNNASFKKPAFMLASPVSQAAQPAQEDLSLPDDLTLPPDLGGGGGSDLSLPDDLSLPLDLTGFPTEQSMKGQAHYTKDFSFTPPTLDEVQTSNPNVSMQELERRLQLGVR